MALDRGRDGADILGLIAGARDPELVDIDVEAGAVADSDAAADPDAGADPAGNHGGDRHALGRVTEEGDRDAVRIVEVGDEAEPPALAHVIHDQTRGLLRLVLAWGPAAPEQAAGIEPLALGAKVAVHIRVLDLPVASGGTHAGLGHRPHADLPIAHMHGYDQRRPHLVLVALNPMPVGDV